jgi:hypothetical protein
MAMEEVLNAGGRSLADWTLALAAMVGGVVGALGGLALGSEAGTKNPLVWGTLGTMLGSGFAVGGWCLDCLFTGDASGDRSDDPDRSRHFTPEPRVGWGR